MIGQGESVRASFRNIDEIRKQVKPSGRFSNTGMPVEFCRRPHSARRQERREYGTQVQSSSGRLQVDAIDDVRNHMLVADVAVQEKNASEPLANQTLCRFRIYTLQ